MDLEYLDPFNTFSPQQIESRLNEDGECGVLTTIEFSKTGFWLAAGNVEGKCFIWDLITSSVAHCIPEPPSMVEGKNPVKSIAWDLQRKCLLIAYSDGRVMEWSIAKKAFAFTFRPKTSLVHASYVQEMQNTLLLVEDLQIKLMTIDGGDLVGEMAFEESISAAAIYEADSMLLLGNSKGEITFIKMTLGGFVVLGKQADFVSSVLQIACHRQKALVLISFKDRAVRAFHLQTQPVPVLTFKHKFFDAIDKVPWQTIGFNHDGEQAFGAVKSKGNHSICLWDLANGTISKTLEGPREDCLDVKWHPKRAIVVSLSKFGILYVWRPVYPKKWSALFPGLEELEENVEYIEREDEFDDDDEVCSRADQNQSVVADLETTIDIHTNLPVITQEDLDDIRLFL